jgi:hypothetical protein
MTNTVHRDPPAVAPVIFSHEAADDPVPRPATGEQVHQVDFSAPTTASTRLPHS